MFGRFRKVVYEDQAKSICAHNEKIVSTSKVAILNPALWRNYVDYVGHTEV